MTIAAVVSNVRGDLERAREARRTMEALAGLHDSADPIAQKASAIAASMLELEALFGDRIRRLADFSA